MIWMDIWYLLFHGRWTIIFWIYNRSNIIQRDNNHCWVIGWEIPSTQHVDVSEMMSHPTTELQTSVFVAKDANLIQWYSGMNGQGQQIICLLISKLDLVVCSYWKARRLNQLWFAWCEVSTCWVLAESNYQSQTFQNFRYTRQVTKTGWNKWLCRSQKWGEPGTPQNLMIEWFILIFLPKKDHCGGIYLDHTWSYSIFSHSQVDW